VWGPWSHPETTVPPISKIGRSCAEPSVVYPSAKRLVLRYYAGLDYEEIASVLQIRTGTVGPTLAAAQSTLRSHLGGLDP